MYCTQTQSQAGNPISLVSGTFAKATFNIVSGAELCKQPLQVPMYVSLCATCLPYLQASAAGAGRSSDTPEPTNDGRTVPGALLLPFAVQ